MHEHYINIHIYTKAFTAQWIAGRNNVYILTWLVRVQSSCEANVFTKIVTRFM